MYIIEYYWKSRVGSAFFLFLCFKPIILLQKWSLIGTLQTHVAIAANEIKK